MKSNILFFFLVLKFVFVSAQTKTVYVSPKGKSINTGGINSPVNTLQNAVNLLEQSFKLEHFNSAKIIFNDGIYPLSKTVNLSPKLFDGKQVSIDISAKNKQQAIISAGIRIPNHLFYKVCEKSQRYRLHSNAAGKVYVANLTGTESENAFVHINPRGEWRPMSEQFSYLTWNEHLLQLACWPNRGYNHIDKIIDGGPTNRWLKPNEKPKPFSLDNPTGGKFTTIEQTDWSKWGQEFKQNGQVIVEGYLHNDWYFQRERVGMLKGNEIQLLHHIRYGIEHKKGMIKRRVRVVNLLCELDEPGEWFFDHETKELYLWPLNKITKEVSIGVIGGEKMVSAIGLENLTIRDLVFQNGGNLGVEILDGKNNLIGGCSFRNFIGRGISVKGGKNHGVTGSTFHGLMGVGSISGGNRKTLEPCHHYITNNEIYNCRDRGYGGMGLSGVGIRFAHNVMHDMNGALKFSGNDIIMEYNEFYNMGWEMGDWNAIYIGADWASWGNEVRYNFVHHLMEMPGAYPVEGFRNDDGGMGVAYHHNVFYKSGRGCIAFSGPGNDCYNNIALETSTVFQTYLMSWGPTEVKAQWEKMKEYDSGKLRRGDKDDKLWSAEQVFGKMGWLFEPYASRYPTLKKVMSNGSLWAPIYSMIRNNYVSRNDVKNGIYTHHGTVHDFPESTDWEFPSHIDMDEAFMDPENLNFQFKPEFDPINGFDPISFYKIGLIKDKYRSFVPSKDIYRNEIKKQYDGVRSAGGRYDYKTAYLRYPLKSYQKL